MASWTVLPPTGRIQHARTALTLPCSIDTAALTTLFVASQGDGYTGSVWVDVEPSRSDDALVEVDAFYQLKRTFDRVKVSVVHAGEYEYGVLISAPRFDFSTITSRDILKLNIRMILPSMHSEAALKLFNCLKTNVHNMSINLNDLAKSVAFGNVELRTSNGSVFTQAVIAESIRVQTSNGAIHGHYETTDDLTPLVLETSNGDIRVDISTLKSSNAQAALLSLRSSNGPIEAAFNLYPPLESSSYSPSYHISAHTSNGPLQLSFPSQPASSILSLDGRTSNAPASVSLHPAYEGPFRIHTSPYMPSPTVGVDRSVPDPAGLGRERNVAMTQVGYGRISGAVMWGNARQGMTGIVDVATSNAPISLKI